MHKFGKMAPLRFVSTSATAAEAAEGGPELQPPRRPRAAGGGVAAGAGVPGPEPQRARGPAAGLAVRPVQASVPAAAGQPAGDGGAERRRRAAAAAGAGPVRVRPDGAHPAGRVRRAGQPHGAVAGPEPVGRADPGDPGGAAAPGPAQPEPEPAGRGDRAAGGVRGAARAAPRRAGQRRALRRQGAAGERLPGGAAVRGPARRRRIDGGIQCHRGGGGRWPAAGLRLRVRRRTGVSRFRVVSGVPVVT